MFGEGRIYLFFGVPKIYFNPAFEARRPVRVFFDAHKACTIPPRIVSPESRATV
jgi:hypothetical protein